MTVDSTNVMHLSNEQLQGPWGGQNGLEFIDMATSIRGIRLRYQKSPGLVGLLEVTYEILGKAFDRKYVQDGPNGNENETVNTSLCWDIEMLGFF